ncbi:EamA family transporter [Actinophytocola sp.]|uniref:EamA family transporter n=1 Tax=Actinophytocola sp. TaxID=1872138 RepID=UPI00389ACA28
MEATWLAVTAIAPVAWGSNYYVTREFLPAGHPFYGALLRALPAGLLLLAVRRLPKNEWWWRSGVLGTLNVGAFFVLIYVAAQQLPTSVASTVMAASPVVMMLLSGLVLADPPKARQLTGAALGILGVALMLLTGLTAVSAIGVFASAGAMAMSSLGYVLAKKWNDGPDVLSLTAWQLVAGALVLLPVAAVAERPPSLDGRAVLGFAYVTVVATALAFVAWFAGLRHLDAGTVGLVGLLNPVTGVLLGTAVAAEALSGRQLAGLVLVLAGIVVPHVGRRHARTYARRRAETIAEAGLSHHRAVR